MTEAKTLAKAVADNSGPDRIRGTMSFARRSVSETAPSVRLPRVEDQDLVSYEVEIANARRAPFEFSLDREGFKLIEHTSSCLGEPDQDTFIRRYADEMTPFIKDYFSASFVACADRGMVLRSSAGGSGPPPPAGEIDGRRLREPGGMVHIDYSPIGAPVVAASVHQSQGLPVRSYSRLMVIQTWRALSPPPQDFPLAFTDGSSCNETDIYTYDYQGFKGCLLHYSPFHRWYYFPDVRPDELILFKGYDSLDHLNPQSAHAAFDNRHTFPDAVPRESIEARFYVYFD